MSKFVAPHMVKNRSGLMVQISSFGGHSYQFLMLGTVLAKLVLID